MEITLDWHAPIPLHDGSEGDQLYSCDERLLPTAAGIYVFARRFGGAVTPLYIGQAKHIRGRIKSQLNSMRLMMRIKKAKKVGGCVLMVATLRPGPGQQVARLLDIVERAYIEQAQSMSYPIINVVHAKPKFHTIVSVGKKKSHYPFQREYRYRARR